MVTREAGRKKEIGESEEFYIVDGHRLLCHLFIAKCIIKQHWNAINIKTTCKKTVDMSNYFNNMFDSRSA